MLAVRLFKRHNQPENMMISTGHTQLQASLLLVCRLMAQHHAFTSPLQVMLKDLHGNTVLHIGATGWMIVSLIKAQITGSIDVVA